MTYTNAYTLRLPPDLVKEVEQWGRDIELTRDEAFEKPARSPSRPRKARGHVRGKCLTTAR